MDAATALKLSGSVLAGTSTGLMLAFSWISVPILTTQISPPLQPIQQHQFWRRMYQTGAKAIPGPVLVSGLLLGAAAFSTDDKFERKLLLTAAACNMGVLIFTSLYMQFPNLELRDRLKDKDMFSDAKTMQLVKTFQRLHWVRNIFGITATLLSSYVLAISK